MLRKASTLPISGFAAPASLEIVTRYRKIGELQSSLKRLKADYYSGLIEAGSFLTPYWVRVMLYRLHICGEEPCPAADQLWMS